MSHATPLAMRVAELEPRAGAAELEPRAPAIDAPTTPPKPDCYHQAPPLPAPAEGARFVFWVWLHGGAVLVLLLLVGDGAMVPFWCRV